MQKRPQDLSEAQLQYYAEVSKNIAARNLLQKLYVPRETGGAFEVHKHHVVSITCSDGPQVCDFNAFARNDASEDFSGTYVLGACDQTRELRADDHPAGGYRPCARSSHSRKRREPAALTAVSPLDRRRAEWGGLHAA